MAEYVTIVDTIADIDGDPENGLLKAILPTNIISNTGRFIGKGEELYKVINGQIFDYATGTQPAQVPVTVNSYPSVSLQLQFKRDGSSTWSNIGYLVTPDTNDSVNLTEWMLASAVGPTYGLPVQTVSTLKGNVTITGPGVVIDPLSNTIFINDGGMVWRADWSNLLVYKPGDLVRFNNSLYTPTAITTFFTNPEVNTAQWQLVVQGGGGTNAFQGEYFNGTTYSTGQIVQFHGNLWVANSAGQHATPGSSDTSGWSLYLLGYAPLGEFDTLEGYFVGDLVTYQGTMYRAIEAQPAPTTAPDPLGNVYWEVGIPVVSGGAGPAGPAGADGAAGPQGPQGDPGPAGADGAAGPQGDPGPAGPAGADGIDGMDGADGLGIIPVWDNLTAYLEGQIVYQNNIPYRALADRPAGFPDPESGNGWYYMAPAYPANGIAIGGVKPGAKVTVQLDGTLDVAAAGMVVRPLYAFGDLSTALPAQNLDTAIMIDTSGAGSKTIKGIVVTVGESAAPGAIDTIVDILKKNGPGFISLYSFRPLPTIVANGEVAFAIQTGLNLPEDVNIASGDVLVIRVLQAPPGTNGVTVEILE